MTVEDDEGFDGVEFQTPLGSFWAGRSHEGNEEFRRARRRVRRMMRFYRHVAMFVSVLILFLVIDIVTGPENFWVQWVALVWGLILFIHWLNVFVFDALLGREAERRMLQRELRRKRREG